MDNGEWGSIKDKKCINGIKVEEKRKTKTKQNWSFETGNLVLLVAY